MRCFFRDQESGVGVAFGNEQRQGPVVCLLR